MGCSSSKKEDVAETSSVDIKVEEKKPEVSQASAAAAELMRNVSSGNIAVSPASAKAAEMVRKASIGKLELPPEPAPAKAAAKWVLRGGRRAKSDEAA